MLFDSRVLNRRFQTRENLQILIEEGIIQNGQNWNHVWQILYRIILHPGQSVLNDIEEVKARLTRSKTFGIQVRTGGRLANNNERISFISEDVVAKIPEQVQGICKRYRIDPKKWNLYISSDSDVVMDYIKLCFASEFNVVCASKYHRGHTTGKRLNNDSLRSALIDMHVLGDSDFLLVTKGSGFGVIAASLAYPHPVFHIPANRTLISESTQQVSSFSLV